MPASSHPPDHEVALTVLLVSYNTRHLLDECLAALKQACARVAGGCQIIVVDNASRDGSAEHLSEHHPDVLLLRSAQNLGFGRANNLALPEVKGEYLLLLNTDAFVAPESLAVSLGCLRSQQGWGILGVRLVGRDGVLQPSCRYFPTPWNVFLVQTGLKRWFPRARLVDEMCWDHASRRECDWVPGCFLLMPTKLAREVGLFDDRFFLYMEEVDLCRRVKQAGWAVGYCPDTAVVHLGGESAGSEAALTTAGKQLAPLQVESTLLYARKWEGRWGVAKWLLFQALALALSMVKSTLKGRLDQALTRWKDGVTWLAMARRTRWGRQPTR